jgi:hypothetical protein
MKYQWIKFSHLGIFCLQSSLLGLLLSSCAAGLNKDECLSANWQTIGYEDGRSGKPTTHIRQHADSCASHNVQVNLDQYHAGYMEGLAQYCTWNNGFEMALQSKKYQDACPASLADEFLDGYRAGKRTRNITSESGRENLRRRGIIRDNM